MSGVAASMLNDFGPTVDSILKELDDNGIKEDRKEIAKKLQALIDFHVQMGEAKVSVINVFLKRHGIKPKARIPASSSKPVKIGDIKEAKKWVEVLGRVSQVWDSTSDSITQKGLLEDETGRIAFTIFSKSNLEPLELDSCYRIRNAVTDEYQGRLSLKLNKTTVIEEVDIDIAPSKPARLEGAIVAILQNSGFVKRCPVCKKILERGDCPKHGRQNNAIQDLTIKAVLDNGREMYTIVADKAATEAVIGMPIAEAAKMVMENLDAECIKDLIKQKLLGRNFIVEGKQNMGYIMPDKFTPVEVTAESVIEAVKRVEAV